MNTNHNSDNKDHVSRRAFMRRSALGAAGVIAGVGLSSSAFGAPPKKASKPKAKPKPKPAAPKKTAAQKAA